MQAHVQRWTEHRLPSGRWSTVRHDEQYSQFTDTMVSNFFSFHSPHERRQYAYFQQGYLPQKVIVPSPDNTRRTIYTFNYL